MAWSKSTVSSRKLARALLHPARSAKAPAKAVVSEPRSTFAAPIGLLLELFASAACLHANLRGGDALRTMRCRHAVTGAALGYSVGKRADMSPTKSLPGEKTQCPAS